MGEERKEGSVRGRRRGERKCGREESKSGREREMIEREGKRRE